LLSEVLLDAEAFFNHPCCVQMDALMRNDWPEEDSGIKTAFAFAMPARVEEILAGKVNFRSETCEGISFEALILLIYTRL
jgi:hypothetical protein